MPNITNKDCERKTTSQVKLYDQKCPGLYVSITSRGATFNLKYFDKAQKKQATVFLGIYNRDTYNVDDARNDGFRLRADAGRGIDIAHNKRVAQSVQANISGKKIAEAIDEYIEFIKTPVKKKDGGLRARVESWNSIEGYFNRSARKRLGNLVCSEVTDDDIASLLNDIVGGKFGKASVSNARHTRGALSTFFKWCARPGRKYVKASPVTNLEPLDPEPSRERVLSTAEIKKLWWGLDDVNVPCSRQIALALKFELVTMLRTKEFLTGTHDELVGLGTKDAQFHIPAERVKKRGVIIQPLSDLAQEIIKAAKTYKNQTHIFDGRTEGEALSDKVLAQALRTKRNKKGKIERLGIIEFLGMKHFTPHDLRRTAASLAADPLGFSDAKIARCLDHSVDRGEDAAPPVTGVYVKSKRIIEKREVLDAVAAELRKVVGVKPSHLKIAA